MEKYLGELEQKICDTMYKQYKPKDWVILWIEMYKGVDGAHHKDWLLDQIARILLGTEVELVVASWDNGHSEERFSLKEPPREYWDWVKIVKDGEDGPNTYDYTFGIAP